jgi:serine/threonine protein kinase
LFSADADRVARFQREAQVLASLNHPNIAHIYGLERAGDARHLVLELVDGPTLADRIAQGSIPIELTLTRFRESIVFRPAIIFRWSPGRGEPSRFFETMQRGNSEPG